MCAAVLVKMKTEVESQLREGGDTAGVDSCAARLMAMHMGGDTCVGGPAAPLGGDTCVGIPQMDMGGATCAGGHTAPQLAPFGDGHTPCNEASTCRASGDSEASSATRAICHEVQRSIAMPGDEVESSRVRSQSSAPANEVEGQSSLSSDDVTDKVKGKMERKDTFSKEEEQGEEEGGEAGKHMSHDR